MPDPLVIWDIDGTLLSSSMERRFLRYLIEQGHVTYGRIAINVFKTLLTRFSLKWQNYKLVYLKGKSEEEVAGWIADCWNESIEPDLFATALEVIRELRTAGIRQVLLSGTVMQLAERLLRLVEVDDLIAASPEVRAGRYTGAVVKPHPRGRRKVSYAAAWLVEHGYDWSHTCVIADHRDDRFLLSRARVGIVVIPGRQLARLAARRGWSVLNAPADYQGLAVKIVELLKRTKPS